MAFQKGLGKHGTDPTAQYKCPVWMYDISKQGIFVCYNMWTKAIVCPA